VSKVLVISPHPDDESIGCGGTLCRHAAAGDEIRVIFLTSGERGSRVMSWPETAAAREREAAAAARVIGIQKLDFWRGPDSTLRCTPGLVNKLAAAIRDQAPDFIYTTHGAESHADHRAAARLVLRAVKEQDVPRPSLRFFEVWTPLSRYDLLEDISAFATRKQRAVQCYSSQLANHAFDAAALGLNRYRGAMHVSGTGEFAEAFLQPAP
jgi:N-acetylglucosamine malate deacetylase 1